MIKGEKMTDPNRFSGEYLEHIEKLMKSGLVKFIFGGIPDKIIKDKGGQELLIYKWDKVDSKILDIAKKYGADGVEMHVTMPKGRGRPHISIYIYWVVDGYKYACKIIQTYLDEIPIDSEGKKKRKKKDFYQTLEKLIRQKAKDYKEGKCKPKNLGLV